MHGSNPIKRRNGGIRPRTKPAGIFPDDDAIVRPAGALHLEQKGERAVQRAGQMTPETIALMGKDTVITLPAAAS